MNNEQKKKNDQENVELHKKPVFEFNPEVLKGHEWKQQGPYLVCKSCELEHSMYIGINNRLVGFDENGKPVIKRLAD